MQTDFGCGPTGRTKAVMLKDGEQQYAVNPPTGFGVSDLVQRVPLCGASGW